MRSEAALIGREYKGIHGRISLDGILGMADWMDIRDGFGLWIGSFGCLDGWVKFG